MKLSPESFTDEQIFFDKLHLLVCAQQNIENPSLPMCLVS